MELIRLKVDGEEVVQAEDAEEPEIINLMDALKKSVAEARGATAAESSVKKLARSAGTGRCRTKKKAV